MKKLIILVGIFIVIIGIVISVVLSGGPSEKIPEGEEWVGSLNLPDRCVMFDQIASRSIKDNIKAAPGKVYSFSVTSSSSLVTYFQIYDQVDALGSVGLATPSFVIPIPAMTTALSPVLVDYTFSMPLSITASGISFAISNNFADYDSSGLARDNFVVQVCYQ